MQQADAIMSFAKLRVRSLPHIAGGVGRQGRRIMVGAALQCRSLQVWPVPLLSGCRLRSFRQFHNHPGWLAVPRKRFYHAPGLSHCDGAAGCRHHHPRILADSPAMGFPHDAEFDHGRSCPARALCAQEEPEIWALARLRHGRKIDGKLACPVNRRAAEKFRAAMRLAYPMRTDMR